MIGGGTIVPHDALGMAGHHVACGSLSCLLDLGSGTLARLHRFGIAVEAIDLIAVTHRHQDHVADLVPLLFSLRYRPDIDREKPLTIVGFEGIGDDLERLSSVFGEWALDPGFPLRVVDATGLPLTIESGDAGIQIDARPVDHTPEAIGYRLRLSNDGREVLLTYTGDTEEGERANALAEGAHVLVAECSTADETPVPGHLTPGGVGRLAAAAGVGRVIVSHRYPSVLALGEDELLRRIGEHYDGPVTPGADGTAIDL